MGVRPAMPRCLELATQRYTTARWPGAPVRGRGVAEYAPFHAHVGVPVAALVSTVSQTERAVPAPAGTAGSRRFKLAVMQTTMAGEQRNVGEASVLLNLGESQKSCCLIKVSFHAAFAVPWFLLAAKS